jgi:hypothetical protein
MEKKLNIRPESVEELYRALEAMVENFWAHGFKTESERMMWRADYPNSAVVRAENALQNATGRHISS